MLLMIDTKTGARVDQGAIRETFRGDRVKVIRATRATIPGKSGKVLIAADGFEQEVYASVVDLEVTEEGDLFTAVAEVLAENAVRSGRDNSYMAMIVCSIAERIGNVHGNRLHRLFADARERRGHILGD